MNARPEIAVVVGAYSRRQYLEGAVRSVLAQTLRRDRFEIVVTKNFRDPGLDGRLAAAGASLRYDEEPRIGRFLRRAVDQTSAPIVTFLNDDDEYEPDRLEAVLATFAARPDLGFYRNRVRVIDLEGRPVPPERWRRHERDEGFDRTGPVYVPAGARDGLFELASQWATPTFNTSTMAIRRVLLDGAVGDAFERTQADDQFLFVAGTLAPYGLYLDDRRLTRFRFSGSSLTHSVSWLGDAADSYGEMAELAARHGRPDLEAWLADLSVHYGRMYRGSGLVARIRARAGRAEVAHRTGDYLRYLGAHPEERTLRLDTWAAAVYGLAYLGAPGFVRSVAETRPAARRGSPPPNGSA